MKIGVFGTGGVGQTLAGKCSQLGHAVVVGTRDPAATAARKSPDAMGSPPFSSWHEHHPQVQLVTLAEAAAHGEILINATSGLGSLEALATAGADNLAGKILIDVANVLDFSRGMPPTLTVCNHDSLAEQIQRALPQTKVVKTLNTMNARLMVDPGAVGGGAHTVFVSGNDAGAKQTVGELLASFGWKDIVDLGDISSARGAEMILPLWLRVFGALKTPMFNFKVVR
jgi:predicted dinucleotide-binding enzyme